ncbi:hypothetical protein, partial [Hungatella hathewayi]|uniref:hypothetical protein n=1 Tax=Hungatella hathewayi TaxID=154046 RepID=UPI0026DB3D4E
NDPNDNGNISIPTFLAEDDPAMDPFRSMGWISIPTFLAEDDGRFLQCLGKLLKISIPTFLAEDDELAFYG